MSTSSIRVRFAPSPTGSLHIGGVRTCLFNWLLAKKNQGSLIVRIEDTDQVRSTRESETMILKDLAALALDYQEGPETGGPFAPYRQSERLAIYQKYALDLLNSNQAYFCFCSDELLTQKKQAALKLGKVAQYDGTCAKLSLETARARIQKGEKAGLRFRALARTLVLEDLVRGSVEFKSGMVGDFFITRSPSAHETGLGEVGFPVYNFCCAIDDHLMNITHVIRAEEHLSNTVRQWMIYEAFGWKLPEYAHISIILGPDRQKLSKRSGDTSVADFLRKGYLPEALLNFLILLGWSPKRELQTESKHPEIFSLKEMIDLFEISGFQKAAAVFDLQKLDWMNRYYLHHLTPEELVTKARPFFEASSHPFCHALMNRDDFSEVLTLLQSEVTLLSDFPKVVLGLSEDPLDLTPEGVELLKNPHVKALGVLWIEELKRLEPKVTLETFEAVLKKLQKSQTLTGKNFFMALRVLATGKTSGPELRKLLIKIPVSTLMARAQSFL